MNISAHGKYPVRHKNMWHGGRMITDKGVRAGINPAPTSPPLQTTFKIGDNSPAIQCQGCQCRGGVYPRPHPLGGNYFISPCRIFLICFAGLGRGQTPPLLTACRTVNGVIPPKRCRCYPPKGIRFYITNPIISTTCYRQRAIWQLNSYTFLLLHTFSTYFFDNTKVFCVKLRKIISKILSIIVKRLIFGAEKTCNMAFDRNGGIEYAKNCDIC